MIQNLQQLMKFFPHISIITIPRKENNIANTYSCQSKHNPSGPPVSPTESGELDWPFLGLFGVGQALGGLAHHFNLLKKKIFLNHWTLTSSIFLNHWTLTSSIFLPHFRRLYSFLRFRRQSSLFCFKRRRDLNSFSVFRWGSFVLDAFFY